MDREFMVDFYENYYEDPLYEALKGDTEYDEDHKKLIQAEDEMIELVGGSETPAGRKFRECVSLSIKLTGYIGLDSYLQGAADREKMLR